MTAFARRRGFPLPSLIDRYILAEAARPLVVSLGLVLTALLLERLLRLFNLLARSGGDALESVVQLVANLVPHYLGLALPAAFFISILLVIARLSEESELDAMLSSGLSVTRIAAPLLWVGVALSLFSIALFGFLQPYSRYAYRAVLYAAVNAGWDARVEPGGFTKAARGFTITADRVTYDGRQLEGIFAQRIVEGTEEVYTARTGEFGLLDGGKRLILNLRNGQRWQQRPDSSSPNLMRFTELAIDTDFNPNARAFRDRGDNERELTMTELWREMGNPASSMPKRRLSAEFHTRLVRALSLPLLPLLAIPLGMTVKRRQRGSALVMAAIILVLYHHGIQLGQSLGTTGRIPSVPAVWVPFALFALFCLWLFRSSHARPGGNPFGGLVEHIERGLLWVRGLGARRAATRARGDAS